MSENLSSWAVPLSWTTQHAKEFLANRIAEQAVRSDVPFSIVEQKMLYFSETHWTLPEMEEVNLAFDRDYDNANYEDKVANLICEFLAWAEQSDSQALSDWKSAVKSIRQEDHYVLVLVDIAAGSLSPLKPATDGSRGRRFLKLFGIALGLTIVIMAILAVFMMLHPG